MFKMMDVMFFPTLYEGDSLACLEAASCGLPLVTSDTGGLWELKRNNHLLSHFIITQQDTLDMAYFYANRIIELYKDKELYAKVSEEYLRWGRKKDIKENMVLYEKIIRGSEDG